MLISQRNPYYNIDYEKAEALEKKSYPLWFVCILDIFIMLFSTTYSYDIIIFVITFNLFGALSSVYFNRALVAIYICYLSFILTVKIMITGLLLDMVASHKEPEITLYNSTFDFNYSVAIPFSIFSVLFNLLMLCLACRFLLAIPSRGRHNI